LGPIGSAVLTFIGYKQTNKQTNRQTDRQAKFIYRLAKVPGVACGTVKKMKKKKIEKI